MLSPFLIYRAATFALFIVCNAVICSVAAWNLGFAQANHNDFATLAQIDSFLLFAGASGLVVLFTIIFVEVFRRGPISSRVWFEIAWLTLFWIFNFAGATGITAVAPKKMCSGHHSDDQSRSACSSARVLIVFAWLNTGFLFIYFFLLTVFAIVHQKEDGSVWHSTVCDFPWFATKQCIRSVPNSPIIARFVKSKSPSLVVPKPRRAPPPPMFIHGRAGLGSQVEIEHFDTDMGALEQQRGASPPAPVPPPPPAALSFYPQHVQSTIHMQTSNTPPSTTYHQSNTYYSSNRGTSPPPIRNWPRTIGSGSGSSNQAFPSSHQQPISDRAAQKQCAPPPPVPSRSASEASRSSSQRSGGGHRPPPPPPPLTLERTTTKESANSAATSAQDSPSRSRPTGPRTRARSGSTGFVRPRPPPLDLTREGATPNSSRR